MRTVKTVHCGLFLILGLALLVSGCVAGQQRGMAGSIYVSTSRPALAVSAPALALKTAGRGTGTLYKPNMGGGVNVTVRTAVYASAPNAPMALVTHAELPSENWIWTTIYPRVGGINLRPEVIGGQGFTAFTYLVPCRNDPFGGLAGETPEEGQQAYWLARYFAARVNFNQDKIILEYREPAPAGLVSLETIPYGMTEDLAAFEERARKAFETTDPEALRDQVRDGYPDGVRWHYMSDLYLGDVLLREPIERSAPRRF
ncbi:MAG: DUF4851 domain-containing protein [Desulfovibrionaceae bacterium]|nr:DUF4851 domain-containing protein [Desulfovibrionaceae bacterium]